ncbi:MAG: NAD(P)/FAD-dependent oxidoreductase [Chloroflexi bacterium]|nr:NAD(P)/FAD-dependent oxidoreductase [Chloroflexota bacterium]
MYDIVVIGGGPVGSRVAYRLAGMGRRTIVVEQKPALGEPVCCTGIISRECVSYFAIEESVIIRQANSARVFSPSGKLLGLRRPEPQAYIVDRSAFNVALAKQAQDRGVDYVMGSPVTNIDVRDDRVSVETGRPQFIEARAVVIATGAGVRLVERLGFGRVGDFAMGVQAVVETKGVEEVEVYLGRKVAPAGFAWLVPTLPGQALVGLLSRQRTGSCLKSLISSLTTQGKIVSAESGPVFAPIPLKPLARTYGDRVLVVGSAAGQVKPTTGGGIYYGLLCADIAADNLHEALESDNLTAKNLAEYEKQWKKKLGREIANGHLARRIYEMLSDRQIDGIIDIIVANGIDEALLSSDDLSFDWHGMIVLKLIGHRALTGIIGKAHVPFASLQK